MVIQEVSVGTVWGYWENDDDDRGPRTNKSRAVEMAVYMRPRRI